jgi:hypothetical protein
MLIYWLLQLTISIVLMESVGYLIMLRKIIALDRNISSTSAIPPRKVPVIETNDTDEIIR